MDDYDLVVVGSGSGLNILEQALQAGWSCALVEADKLGGTCLTRGCIPSKVLTVPADIIREAEHARRLGLEFPRPKIEWPTVGRRMWQQINESLVIEEELAGFPKVAVYRGVGEFTAPRRMRVKLNDGSGYSEEFSARRFVLATGARSFVPPIQGLEETGYLTTETFFGDKFPQAPWSSLAIIGGGLIAAELGHVFSAFGTRVTILEMEDRLVPTEEPEICDLVARMFRTLMDVRLGVRAVAARTGAGGRKVVSYVDAHTGRTGEVEADEILVAAGRRSNADLLQADRAGIKLDRKGWIEADRHLQTSSPDVWAIGDAIGGFQFRHKANSDADVCAHNLLEPGQAKLSVDYSVVPWAIYTHPQVGHVGLTERQALDAGSEILVAVQHYSDIARGFAMGYEPGRRPLGPDPGGPRRRPPGLGPGPALRLLDERRLLLPVPGQEEHSPLQGSAGLPGRRHGDADLPLDGHPPLAERGDRLGDQPPRARVAEEVGPGRCRSLIQVRRDAFRRRTGRTSQIIHPATPKTPRVMKKKRVGETPGFIIFERSTPFRERT
jgi:mycothione reductase